jgi:hypothetical protein
MGDDEQVPDLADLGERALARRHARPSLVELPAEVVEEDPPSRTEQAVGQGERQGVDIPGMRAVDEDEVVPRLDPAASRELGSQCVVQEPRVARLLVGDVDAGAETSLLDHVSCRWLSTLCAASVDGGQRADPVGLERGADVERADPVPDAELQTGAGTVFPDEPVQLLAALGGDSRRQRAGKVGHLRRRGDGHGAECKRTRVSDRQAEAPDWSS